MKLVKFFFILLLFISYKINSKDLISHLNKFFQQEYSLKIHNFKIVMIYPSRNIKICKKPYFFLSNNSNYFSLFDILYACNKKYQHLKLELQIKGKYIVSNKKIPRGTKINESDLQTMIGRLDKLPKGAYFHKKDVIDRVNLHDILPFQPITSFITRAFWIVKSNQKVTIKIKAVSFEIITFGTSLDNGGVNEKIRIKTKNGKIVTGIINNNGDAIVLI